VSVPFTGMPGPLWVQDAGHALPGEDLQVGVGEHGVGVPLGAQDSAGEAGGGLDAVAVGLGRWAADLLAFKKPLMGVGEGVQSSQPVLEREVVGET
jgi:hypothetical protein